jgi:hypothetical protein
MRVAEREHVVAGTLPKTVGSERDGKTATLGRTHRPAPNYEVHPSVEHTNIMGEGRMQAPVGLGQQSSVAHTTLTFNTVEVAS